MNPSGIHIYQSVSHCDLWIIDQWIKINQSIGLWTDQSINLMVIHLSHLIIYPKIRWMDGWMDGKVNELGWVFINPLLHTYSFWCINNRQLLKTLWENEKLLIMSNFSFSHNVFNSKSDNCIPLCPFFDIISLFAVELERPKIVISGKRLRTYLYDLVCACHYTFFFPFFLSFFKKKKKKTAREITRIQNLLYIS